MYSRFDEFRVHRVTNDSHKYELRDEEEPISNTAVYGPIKLWIEKGIPNRRGEIFCNFFLYELSSDNRIFLFELAIPGKSGLQEIKSEVINNFNELKSENDKFHPNINFPTIPKYLRIRDFPNRPSTIHISEKKKLKDLVKNHTTIIPEITLQILNQKETKTSEDYIVLLLYKFLPDKYKLRLPVEITVEKLEKFNVIKSEISDAVHIPIKKLSIAFAEKKNIDNILTVSSLVWYPAPKEDKSPKRNPQAAKRNNMTLSALGLEDGSILLCRDSSIPLKKLSSVEKQSIKEEESQKQRRKSNPSPKKKETNLDITIRDVSILDIT